MMKETSPWRHQGVVVVKMQRPHAVSWVVDPKVSALDVVGRHAANVLRPGESKAVG